MYINTVIKHSVKQIKLVKVICMIKTIEQFFILKYFIKANVRINANFIASTFIVNYIVQILKSNKAKL